MQASPKEQTYSTTEAPVLTPVQYQQVRWSAPGRFAFRFAFLFLLLSLLIIFSPLRILPLVGDPLSNGVDWLASHAAIWVGQHVVHLTGVAATDHPTDSRDTALNWITLVLTAAFSLLAVLVWTALDRHRAHYQAAAAWLRFLLRMFLVFLMLRYGLGKVFPLQMARPSLAVLNEPLGQSSPMTLLWTLIGLHPAYQIACGCVEVLAALLLFYERTALVGALLNAFILANVLLYNLFFDVPVKLGAGLLLLATLAIIAPDAKPLYHFFWSRRPAAPTGVWTPATRHHSFVMAKHALEAAYLVFALYTLVPGAYALAKQERVNVQHPAPFTGEWQVDSDRLTTAGLSFDQPILTAEGSPLTALYLELDGRVMARSADQRLWRASVQIDPAKHTFELSSGWFEGTRFQGEYLFSQPDPNHLVLTPVGKAAATYGTLTLSRVPLPERYPLLERGFHWVNEWALER